MPVFHRREQPPTLSDYHGYKPYLRRDFLNRCAYCLLHEGDEFAGGSHAFAIDHFRPKEYFPHLEATYENLYYACRWCNRAKWDIWPSEDELGTGYCFVDPCQEDLYLEHSRTDRTTGLLEARSKTGRRRQKSTSGRQDRETQETATYCRSSLSVEHTIPFRLPAFRTNF